VYLTLEVEHEADGRFVAEVPELPGVLAYGTTEREAVSRAQALALRMLADRLENEEPAPSLLPLDFRAA
jgi:predicted RNase H-like HicB family nuclease